MDFAFTPEQEEFIRTLRALARKELAPRFRQWDKTGEVANAAATAFRPMLEQKKHNVRRTFAISVDAFVAAVRAAVPLMDGRPGRVVGPRLGGAHEHHRGHVLLGRHAPGAQVRERVDVGSWRNHTVDLVLERWATRQPAKTVLVDGCGWLTWSELARLVERVAYAPGRQGSVSV